MTTTTYVHLHEHLRLRRGANRHNHATADLKLSNEVHGDALRRRPDVNRVVRTVLRPPFPSVRGLFVGSMLLLLLLHAAGGRSARSEKGNNSQMSVANTGGTYLAAPARLRSCLEDNMAGRLLRATATTDNGERSKR